MYQYIDIQATAKIIKIIVTHKKKILFSFSALNYESNTSFNTSKDLGLIKSVKWHS